MQQTVDGILLGGGHNSLILQAYASQAGLETVCLEKNSQVGGGLRTEQLPHESGFWHNTHSFYHRGITQMPWYRDLDLEHHGASYIQPDLNVAVLERDGPGLQWWTDVDRTFTSFQQLDDEDANTMLRWREEFVPIVQQLLIPEAQAPPLPPAEREKLFSQSALGRRLLEVSRLSPLEFVLQEFRHPLVQAGLLFFNGLREVDLREPGFGHHIPSLLAADAYAQICRGGSRRLAEALVRAVEEAGGRVLPETVPARILTNGERAVGVETESGEVIMARRFIASGLNPQQTFLELLDASQLPSDWRRMAEDFRYNLLAPLFGTYVNLRAPLQYAASDSNPDLAEALMVILGLEQPGQFMDIVEHHQKGTLPAPVMWGSSPSVFDSLQAPSGQHTAFMWEKLPYHLGGDAQQWDAEKDRVGERMMAAWQEYAPCLCENVLEVSTRSPLDTFRQLPNMRDGDLLVGALTSDQMGYHRPFPGAGHYRGHLEGLYLCGSSCHPGGNVTGLPGYNCAQVLLADLGLGAEWLPGPLLDRLPRG